MSQIEIEVLKQGTRYTHVISVSFFTMPGAYRNVEVYQKNLRGFLEKTTNLNEFEVRIYTDNTGKEFALEIAKDRPDVTVLKYDCPFFHEGTGHTGTFGTIVRFLPLFEPGLDTVWISDIDVHPSFITMDIVEDIKKHKVDIFIDSVVCYDRKPWADVKNPIIAHRFISRVRFPKQLLTHFLTSLMNGSLDPLIEKINQYNERKQPNSKFPYGIDEAFLNGPLYRSIKRRDLNVLVRKDYFTNSLLAYNVKNFPKSHAETLAMYYRSPTPNLFKKAKEIHKKYAPLILDQYPCMQELLDSLPTLKHSFSQLTLLPSSEL